MVTHPAAPKVWKQLWYQGPGTLEITKPRNWVCLAPTWLDSNIWFDFGVVLCEGRSRTRRSLRVPCNSGYATTLTGCAYFCHTKTIGLTTNTKNILASLFYLRVKYSFSVETVSRNIVTCTSTGNHHVALMGIWSNLNDGRVPEPCSYTGTPSYLPGRWGAWQIHRGHSF